MEEEEEEEEEKEKTFNSQGTSCELRIAKKKYKHTDTQIERYTGLTISSQTR